jgi:hypothetical protein
MLDTVFFTLIFLFFIGIGYLLYLQQHRRPIVRKKEVEVIQPLSFVPMEDRIVPTHANYSNKFNDVIGNETSGIIGKGVAEIVIPSDWYMSRTLPTEFDGPYWPNGMNIEPDFIYPGSDPKRPLRSQTLYASQIFESWCLD